MQVPFDALSDEARVWIYPSSRPFTDDECIEIDLSSFFQAVDLSKQDKIMRPGKEAVKLSHIWKECWQIGTR